MSTPTYYESFGILLTGVVFGISLLRLLVLLVPQWVAMLLGLKTLGWSYNAQTTEQTTQVCVISYRLCRRSICKRFDFNIVAT
jgi:hypothetical protein